MMASLLIGSLALPLALQEVALHHIRSSTLAAVRMAAQHDPSQLSQLPVEKWREHDGVDAAHLYRQDWERFEMHIPRAITTVVADVNLQPLAISLLLGFGGWLRVLACMGVSGALVYAGQRWSRRNGIQKPAPQVEPSDSKTAPDMDSLSLLQASLTRLPSPALVLNRHHQLCVWNESLSSQITDMQWVSGLHLLDFALQLPWGTQLMEAVDSQKITSHILIIKEGETLCVTST